MTLVERVTGDVRPGLYLVAGICGMIDVTCIKALGGVFAEMMTGNLLLMAVDVGSGGTFERASRYLWPLIAFMAGAIWGGRLLLLPHEKQVRRAAFLIVWVTIVVAAVVCWIYEPNGKETLGHAITALLALGMGLQTAVLRRHGVQDLATNVMTLTLTALLSESRLGEGSRPNVLRRASSIACFFSGGVVAAALVPHGTVYPLGLAAILYSVAIFPLMLGEKPH
jgi:uncharacterized membrane protein YoaK (UPF0700 family)